MGRLIFLLSLLGIVMLGLPSPLLAADEGNPMKIEADTAIWSIVVFISLFLILYFKAWPLVLEGLQKREESIRTSLEEAKKTRDDMARMQAEFKKELAEAHLQIPALMEEARKKGDAMVAQRLAEAAARIQADQERFRHEMEVAKDQAIKELWAQAAQLATLISAKAIGRALSEEDHRRLIDEALQEMARTANN